ncbi:MAG TPA: GAF and ANTAR domain-containing protein [Ornithinibacter sp.]|nr:GAF and ANTAR domain-containing protein [Ornithinibacter sp.]
METREEMRTGPGVVPRLDLQEVAEAMRSLSERSAADHGGSPLDAVVHIAVEQVPRASWASVTMLRGGCFKTPAATDEAATRADLLQYDIGSGPCVDAVLDDSLYVTGDVAADSRWPVWGQRAAAEVGVRSVLAMRLHLHREDTVIAGLNIYGVERDAFDDHAVGMGLVLATHASSVVGEMLASDRAENLMKALESNRDIGVAMGVLMQTHQFTREQAFDVLRVASQDTNRKLADIAAEVAETGVLEIRRRPPVAGGATSTA